MKLKHFFLSVLFFTFFQVFSEEPEIHFNPWELIIYRPENTDNLNKIRCWLHVEDENGNDVTYTKIKATYEWINIPGVINWYEKHFYLSGGMAMHLNIKPGKYKISVYSEPKDIFGISTPNKGRWESNVLEYDTDHPVKVIFVAPVANDNGFYTGEWKISYTAPKFFKYTKPWRK